MKFEHFALNVENPVAMTEWYTTHLGLSIVRQLKESPFTTFLADSSGQIMLEIYHNTLADVPVYSKMHPLVLHLAFVSHHPVEDMLRLTAAGAILESDQKLGDGSHLVMLRDPWGFSIQLCKRGIPMILGGK